jgi:hypothetical protein
MRKHIEHSGDELTREDLIAMSKKSEKEFINRLSLIRLRIQKSMLK